MNRNNGWMTGLDAMGVLKSTTDHPSDTSKTIRKGSLTVDKRRLLEDYQDKTITLEEFRERKAELDAEETNEVK